MTTSESDSKPQWLCRSSTDYVGKSALPADYVIAFFVELPGSKSSFGCRFRASTDEMGPKSFPGKDAAQVLKQ